MPTRPTPRALLIALNACPDLHRAAICRLAQDPEGWIKGSEDSAAHRLGVAREPIAQARKLLPKAEALAAREEDAARRIGCRLITRCDSEYPPSLSPLPLPPPVLYLRGDGAALTAPAIAMVGSRRASPYGVEVATHFAQALATEGLTIVSGFAYGIDAAAHRGALRAGGKTLAVLGCGQDVRYPSAHRELGSQIAEQGALITELPLRHPPRRWCFPMRNRLIAALTLGTLVVQAAERSGSLITAHHALDLGKEVWAVPGSIFDPGAVGPNRLIRDGAGLATEPRDILDFLLGPAPLPLEPAAVTPGDLDHRPTLQEARPMPQGAAGKVLRCLAPGIERSPDDLSSETGLPVDAVLTELLELELAGWLTRLPGPLYRRR